MKNELKGWGERDRQTMGKESSQGVIRNLMLRVETMSYSLACPHSLAVLIYDRYLE